jgi:hypothetical protein
MTGQRPENNADEADHTPDTRIRVNDRLEIRKKSIDDVPETRIQGTGSIGRLETRKE